MAISILATVTGSSGSGTSADPFVTLPAGIGNGDLGVLLVSSASGGGSMTAPSGWTLLSGSPLVSGSVLAVRVYTRALTAADSSSTVTAIAASSKWTATAIVLTGADTNLNASATATATSNTTSLTVPAVTPTVNDCLLIQASGIRYASATVASHTAASGWTEQAELVAGASPVNAAALSTRQLSGGAGVAQGPWTATIASGQHGTFTLAVAPKVAVGAERATAWDALALVGASRATAWDVTSSTSVGAERATAWNISALVGNDRDSTWDVLATVIRTRVTAWDVRVTVGADTATAWDVADPPVTPDPYAAGRTPGELRRAETRAFEAALTEPHTVRVRVSVLDLDGEHLDHLDAKLVDGQVNVDADAEVIRSASLTLFDPDHALHLDSDSPSDGALFLDRMLRVTYGVWVADLGDGSWVDVPVFTGPIVKLDRDVDVINVECHDKSVLAQGQCWRPLTIRRGTRKVAAIRTILAERAGETRFDLPDLPGRLDAPLSLGRLSTPWSRARRIARGLDRQLFYTAAGICRLRRWPGNVTWTFGARAVLTPPQLGYSTEDVRNVVWVRGGKPKGVRKRFDPIPDDPDTPKDESVSVDEQVDDVPDVMAEVVAPRSHPLSPWRLGRNGVPRFLVHVLENDHIRTREDARRRAKRRLDDLLEEALDVSFDSMPVPHLEPGDRVRVSTGDWSMAFRLRQFSLPLVVGSPMSVGYHARVSVRRRRVRLRRARGGDAAWRPVAS